MAIAKKYLLPSGVLILLLAGGYAYREYTRKPASLKDTAPQEIVSAAEMIKAFEENEDAANTRFLGKTVQVYGPVAEIINEGDTMMTVLLGNANELHKVSCSPEKGQWQKLNTYSPGRIITVKGICTGFLADAELNRCVIVNTNVK